MSTDGVGVVLGNLFLRVFTLNHHHMMTERASRSETPMRLNKKPKRCSNDVNEFSRVVDRLDGIDIANHH